MESGFLVVDRVVDGHNDSHVASIARRADDLRYACVAQVLLNGVVEL